MAKLNGWRCAKTQPPKHFNEVLVYGIPRDPDGTPSCNGQDKHGGLVALGWYQREERAGWMADWLDDNEVLFWKPLPKLPEFE
jgi:hypothetical protein